MVRISPGDFRTGEMHQVSGSARLREGGQVRHYESASLRARRRSADSSSQAGTGKYGVPLCSGRVSHREGVVWLLWWEFEGFERPGQALI